MHKFEIHMFIFMQSHNVWQAGLLIDG
jgi:hypothetical protein